MTPLTDATRQWIEQTPPVCATDRLYVELDADATHFVLRLRAVNDGFPSAGARAFPQRCLQHSRQDASAGTWLVGATDSTVHLIDAIWPPDQVVASDEAQVMMDWYRTKTAAQETHAEAVAQWKTNELVENKGYDEHPDFPLSPVQRLALNTSMKMEGRALFMEQGVGKTAPTIARICNEAKEVYARDGRMYRAVVLCPKALRVNWEMEIKRFATEQVQIVVMRGLAMDRRRLFIEGLVPKRKGTKAVIFVCGYGTFATMANIFCAIEWDLAVLDESQAIKSSKTKRWPLIRKFRDRCRQRMILTGTPVGNSPLDLYTQFEFLALGESGFTAQTPFNTFYGQYTRDERGVRFLVGANNIPFLQERLARLALTVTKEEALKDLPSLVNDAEEVPLSPQQAEVYQQLANELYAEIERDLAHAEASGANAAIVIQNVLTKLLKLAQVTAGHVNVSEIRDENGRLVQPRYTSHFEDVPKLDRLIELIDDGNDKSKKIVWSCFTPAIDDICERLDAAGIKYVTYYGKTTDAQREDAVRAFNSDPTIKVFVGNPQAGGVGLNLLGYNYYDDESEWIDTNADHTIHFACSWSFIIRSQADGRGHRRGTRVQHRVTDLLVPNTVDQQIRERVAAKRDMAFALRDVRELLKGLL